MLSNRPQSPKEEDCCGNSCNPCIFDVHKNLLKQWELKKLNSKSNNLLEPLVYKLFKVYELKQLNNDYISLILRYSDKEINDGRVIFNPGQHVVINYLKWSKPFTPISWTDDTIKFLIRIYADGINTKRLKNLESGELIKVRGPYGDFVYSRNKFKSIVMFSVGSGLAAFVPIIKSIIDDEEDETRVCLNAGFRSVDLVPLTKNLQLFTDYWNVECNLYLTEDASKKVNGINIEKGRIDEKICKCILDNYLASSSLVLICGTEKFNLSLERWIVEYNFVNYHVFK
ncbi:Similar to Cyb5rl: NADH-cytochrome b5 reductase-like (Mus musculus) [Cotesia congregata]|uniref:Similar to Cyb5rl: NADH-cytochrome b5 reductase-like (Mus musculus) n=1 Tax=Cotesia congregata TaxID=51543 RepID=A0A8J2MYC3_COTCN|nr:Similar to Cyb5rl: NADH-cytochrome b5 reductase-like (Mus musculus) [Cotesia congregata]